MATLFASPAGLPVRPAFEATLPQETSQAGPSRSSCFICSQPSRYTCPRCSLRICSLSCSNSHKTQLSCSGTRDLTSYISPNAFSQQSWSDDYAFLENARRDVAAIGKKIPPKMIANAPRGRGPRPVRFSRVEGLRRELERREIWMGLMPDGMDRRKENQSSYNPK